MTSNSKQASFKNGYALIIGTGTDLKGSTYKSNIDDANSFHNVLIGRSTCAYPDSQVKILCGSNATRENIEKELHDLKTRINDLEDCNNCTLVIFFSGHGAQYEKKNYLLPYGCKKETDLPTNAIDGEFLFEKLATIMAGNVLLFVNACFPKDADFPEGKGDYNLTVCTEPLKKQHIKNLGEKFFALSAVQNIKSACELYSPKSSKCYSPFAAALFVAFSGKNSLLTDGFVRFNDVLEIFNAYLGLDQASSMGQKDGNPEVGCWTEAGSRAQLLDDLKPKKVVPNANKVEDEVDELDIKTNVINYSGNFTSSGTMILGNNRIGDNARF